MASKQPVVPSDPRRVSTAEEGGYRADTDDVLEDLDLGVGVINPNGQKGTGRNGVGGAGMMPPMMAGGRSAAAGEGAAAQSGVMNTAAKAGFAGAGAKPGTGGAFGAPGAGINPSGEAFGSSALGAGRFGANGAGTGSVGSGGAFGSYNGIGGTGAGGSYGSSGFGSGAGTIAAGAEGADYGFGINPATGKPWTPADPGFAEQFGTFDPETGLYLNHKTGTAYNPKTGFSAPIASLGALGTGAGNNWYTNGTSATPGAAGPGYGFGASNPAAGPGLNSTGVAPGSLAASDGAGHLAGYTPGTYAAGANTGTDAGVTPNFGTPDFGSAGTSSGYSSAGAGAGYSSAGLAAGTSGGGFAGGGGDITRVETGDLGTTSKRWDDLSVRMAEVHNRIYSLVGSMEFGKVYQPRPQYYSAVTAAVEKTDQSIRGMSYASTGLAQSRNDYDNVEQSNAALAEEFGDRIK